MLFRIYILTTTAFACVKADQGYSQKLYTVLDRMYKQDRLMKLPAPPESIRIASAVVHWSLKIVYLIFGEDIF